jgi:nucleoid DNA-binding protein
MDKPVSISVKVWIIRNISVRTGMKESEIETIVNHQFESALCALDIHNSLEFSGFGKLFFNRPKAIKKLEKFKSQLRGFRRILNDPSYTELRKRNIRLKGEATIKNFNHLNKKLNGHSQSLQGLEESSLSSEEIEGIDSESGREENDNM